MFTRLLHGETLLVIASRDLEDISLEVVTDVVSGDLGRDALVVERAQLVLVVDLHHLLATGDRVRNVQLPTGNGAVEWADGGRWKKPGERR